MKNEEAMKFMQAHLGYNDAEAKLFNDNPRNADVVSKSAALMRKTIVLEVIESKGCNSHHKVGDKFYFDGAGNLITKLNPKKICCFALQPMASLIFGMNELFYAGVDPNEMRFKHTGCFDVGVACGGWGHIVMQLRVVDRQK